MNFSAPFINRPIATILLMAGLLLCGLATYRLLVLAQKSNRPWDRFADEACGRRFLIIRLKR